ncbi:MAG: hypothetical protein E6J72_06510 [Deltaproteobacteria bacterium]|nr:MAG: hypothetical protein E6J72_06510 [Deltaproteobacteria bacterium]
MLKFGVVSRHGVRWPRTLLGRRRYVSLLLLRELAHDPATSADEYDRLAGHACMPNGVWKLTRHGRLRLLDDAVVEILRQRHPPGSALTVCDLAASTGATSVDFFRALAPHFDVRFTASDLYRDVVAVRNRRWPAAIVFDGAGQEIQYIFGPFVLPRSPAESPAYPINHALKAVLRSRLVPAARTVLDTVNLKALGPFDSVDVKGYEVVKLPMLTRDTLAAIGAHDGFTFEEWNVLEPLPARAHVVRCMNILTPEHFPDEVRTRAIRNCVDAVLPGGLFIVGSSPTADATMVQASIYAVDDGRLVRLRSLNDGSEIDALVGRTYRVVDSREDAPSPAAASGRAVTR